PRHVSLRLRTWETTTARAETCMYPLTRGEPSARATSACTPPGFRGPPVAAAAGRAGRDRPARSAADRRELRTCEVADRSGVLSFSVRVVTPGDEEHLAHSRRARARARRRRGRHGVLGDSAADHAGGFGKGRSARQRGGHETQALEPLAVVG